MIPRVADQALPFADNSFDAVAPRQGLHSRGVLGFRIHKCSFAWVQGLAGGVCFFEV